MPVTEIKNFWERLIDRITDGIEYFVDKFFLLFASITWLLLIVLLILRTIKAISIL